MNDPVENPEHYILPNGNQLIDFLEHLPYCRGAAIKYIFRAGKKDKSKEIEDLKKARWMIDHEIKRMEVCK